MKEKSDDETEGKNEEKRERREEDNKELNIPDKLLNHYKEKVYSER